MDPSALKSPELQHFLNGSDMVKCLHLTNFCSAILDFLQQEKERAMINEMVGKLTSACWDKCITGTPGSKFSSSESNCLSNCAQRYMEMSLMIVKRFQSMQ
uniref:Mitochondrial import inner membrane translocase subunit n=2 Tax=Solanum tuberosum TaxID=4113 RepID=M1CKN8_SOLTU